MFSFDDLHYRKGRTLIMGILNITPDSFSDGGEAFSLENVKTKVDMLQKQGADIIDVGACSTAPGNGIVSQEEEIRRLKMFLPCIMERALVPVSVDTFRPEAAKVALSYGVSIINDESGCCKEEMARLVKNTGCGWVLMHTGNKSSSETQEYEQGVIKAVCDFFEDMKSHAFKYGVKQCQLALDCGIGFGKTREDDLALLSNCDVLSSYGNLLVGASRKRIIGELTGESVPANRVEGSVAVAKIVSQDGAAILRVHDVEETLKSITE